MAAEDNPYRSPQIEPEDGESCRSIFPPLEAYERPEPDEGEPILARLYMILGGAIAFGWVALAMVYPLIWASINLVLIVIGAGLLTTKIVFGFERPMYVWGLTPVFGCGWVLFVWILFKLFT